MENHENHVLDEEPRKSLTDEQVSRSVVVSNIPANTEYGKLYIHFQKTSEGGGEIENLQLLGDGTAILTYEEVKVAESVLQRKHEFSGVELQLEPYKKNVELKKQMEVFSLVSAKINPSVFNMATEEITQALTNIQEKTKTQFLELCDGIWVSGTYEQIQMTCSMLSTIATPRGAPEDDAHATHHKGTHSDEGKANAHTDLELEPVTLDVQPKLIYLLRRNIQEIEDKYKIKIANSPNSDKATLSPVGSEKLFEEGKEEFITLYQSAFQKMDEKRFELVTDDSDTEKIIKELMGEYEVVIDRKDKTICIYGRNDHVGIAMQRLQGKPRRSRKAFKEANDELAKPDTYAQLPKVLKQTLENGVTVSVYQGDITKQHVDVIVNAANERLEHGGGVAGAIVKIGGFQIQLESRQIVQRYGPIPVGQVAHTGPGHLPCKRIIHAIGPQWRVHGPEGSRKLLFNACWNSFVLASQLRLGSIVLPGISSGIYGVPIEVCTEMMFTAAESFSCEATAQNLLKDIRFVNIDSPTNEAFRQEFHKRYVEKSSSGFENGPQNGKEPLTDNQTRDDKQLLANGGQTNKGSQMPPVNPSNIPLQRERPNKPGSYAAAAAPQKRWETNQPSLQGKAPTNMDLQKPSFKQGYEERHSKNKESQVPAIDPSKDSSKKAERDEKPGDKAATAALKRMQENQPKVDSDASVQPSTHQQSSENTEIKSFGNAFKNRQGNTIRENTEEIKGKFDDQNHHEADINHQTGTKNDTTDKAENPNLVKTPQEIKSTMKPNDGQENTVESSPVNKKTGQSGRKEKNTTIDKSTIEKKNTQFANIFSSPRPIGRGKGLGRGQTRNGETQLKLTGRARGALSLAAKFGVTPPGAAVREEDPNLKNGSNPTVTTQREVKHPPKPEHDGHLQTHPQKLQSSGNSQEQPQVHPPGLEVTSEGLNLAANCNAGDSEVGSPKTTPLPDEEKSKVKTPTCSKRKMNKDDSPRSPKLRKEDEQEHDGETETKQEGERDGHSANEMSIPTTTKQESVETKDILNTPSKKEKDGKEKDNKSTSEEGDSKETAAEMILKDDVVGKNERGAETQMEVKNDRNREKDETVSNEDIMGKNERSAETQMDVKKDDNQDEDKVLKEDVVGNNEETTELQMAMEIKKDNNQDKARADDNDELQDQPDLKAKNKDNSDDDGEVYVVNEEKTNKISSLTDSSSIKDDDEKKATDDGKGEKTSNKITSLTDSSSIKDDDEKKATDDGNGEETNKISSLTDSSLIKDDDEKKATDDGKGEETSNKISSLTDSSLIKDDGEKKATDDENGEKTSNKISSLTDSSSIKDDDEKKATDDGKGEKTSNKISSLADSLSIKDDDEKKATDDGKGEETESSQQTNLDETQNEPPMEDGSLLHSFVVLPFQSEKQPRGENHQEGKRGSEDSSSSESIVLLSPTDEDMNLLKDAPCLESQANESRIDQNNGKPIIDKTSNFDDSFCENLSCAEIEAAKEQHVGTGKSEEFEKQQVENATGGTTETPLSDHTLDKEDQRSSDENNQHQQDSNETVDDVAGRSVTASQTDESDDLVQAMGTLSLSKKPNDMSKKDNPEPLPSSDQTECGLCTTAFSKDRHEVILSGCGHVICKECSTKYKAEQIFICPTCEKKAGCNAHQPPGGKMKHGILDQSLEGYNDHKTVYIDYQFPAGVQGSCHPNPGSHYDELSRRTFLPDTEEGQKVLELLRQAFDAGVLFTVGKCSIKDTHKENQIIFNDAVEHKINIPGGRPSCRGYPDPDYLERVKLQLHDIGID